MLELQFNIC